MQEAAKGNDFKQLLLCEEAEHNDTVRKENDHSQTEGNLLQWHNKEQFSVIF